MFGSEKVSCVNRSGHGIETLEKALMDSCNDALMQMSYKIGAEISVLSECIWLWSKDRY